jgi:hypothetical protein
VEDPNHKHFMEWMTVAVGICDTIEELDESSDQESRRYEHQSRADSRQIEGVDRCSKMLHNLDVKDSKKGEQSNQKKGKEPQTKRTFASVNNSGGAQRKIWATRGTKIRLKYIQNKCPKNQWAIGGNSHVCRPKNCSLLCSR